MNPKEPSRRHAGSINGDENGPLLRSNGQHIKGAGSYTVVAPETSASPARNLRIEKKVERGGDGHDHCVIALHESMKGGQGLEEEEDDVLADRVRFAVHMSITANVILCAVTIYAVVSSKSLAVLASLADTLIDLVSQGVLAVSEWVMRKPSDKHYPAGRSRIEPLGVIIVSILMGIAALELFRASITSLVMSLVYHQRPALNMQDRTIFILIFVVSVKFCLFLYSKALARRSGTAEALSEDNWNDVMINTFSIISSIVAHFHKELWWFDPAGAILISTVIMYNWLHVGLEHATKIVGLSAPPETLEEISTLAGDHHPELELDIIRAYHFGPNFLVELECVLPGDMSVRQAHDIALSLQQKVESRPYVERCFVHVDYTSRPGINEHKI